MLARCIQSISDVKYREINLQRGQFIFLTRICEQPGINLIELSDILKVDKTTTTKAINKLLSMQYISRKRNLADKREWHLYPTAIALKLYEVIIAEENRNIALCFAGLSSSEQLMATGLLQRMRQNIEQDWITLKNRKQAKIMNEITIREYREGDKEAIIDLILHIQRQEFSIPITREDQPDLSIIPDYYQQGCGNFWVAMADNTIVGTLALIDIGNTQGVLRKMFVKAPYRGRQYNTASLLLQTTLNWAKENSLTELYLGTTDKFLAAHRFYEKNNFVRITKESLPPAFPMMKIDSVFYKLTM